jgi:hypothetical protein
MQSSTVDVDLTPEDRVAATFRQASEMLEELGYEVEDNCRDHVEGWAVLVFGALCLILGFALGALIF